MKAEFAWTDKEQMIGEIHISETDREEMARFYTRFKEHLCSGKQMVSVSCVDEKDDEATYSVLATYIHTDYYQKELGTCSEYIDMLDTLIHRYLQYDYSKDTNTTLMNAIVRELKKQGLYDKFRAIEEYYRPESSNVCILTDTDFEFVSYVNDGSEGTWLDCYIQGYYRAEMHHEGPGKILKLGTFKTLEDDLNAALVLGELGGAIYYVGRQYVNRNYKRFTPEPSEVYLHK